MARNTLTKILGLTVGCFSKHRR